MVVKENPDRKKKKHLYQISANLKTFKFWDLICPKNMIEKNFEKVNIKTVISI